MIPQQLFQEENTTQQGKEIFSALWFKLFIFLFHTAKITLRSNKFIWAYLFVHVFFCLFYVVNPVIYSILPIKASGSFLIYIVISDVFLKYYMPGQFVEYILPLIRISLSNRLVSVYILFNILFYYTNISVLFSVFLGVRVESVVFLLTSLILNHIIVLLVKINPNYQEELGLVFFVFLLAILNIVGILFVPNLGVSIAVLIIALFFTKIFLRFYFHAKI